jgi:hypothetical protein
LSLSGTTKDCGTLTWPFTFLYVCSATRIAYHTTTRHTTLTSQSDAADGTHTKSPILLYSRLCTWVWEGSGWLTWNRSSICDSRVARFTPAHHTPTQHNISPPPLCLRVWVIPMCPHCIDIDVIVRPPCIMCNCTYPCALIVLDVIVRPPCILCNCTPSLYYV